jgi:membrane protein YqaA with SNARE-associated domain
MATPALAVLVRPVGDRRWDWFLRGTVVAAVLGIGVALALPATIPLVWLGVLGIPANSPLSPVVPTAFEPIIIEAAKYARPLSVSLVALAVYLYTEYLNWYLYGWVLHGRRAAWLREQRWVQRGVEYFARAPFVTVVVFAFTPLPFWAARGLAILKRYPLTPFMVATAVGRWPRFALYAWLGSAFAIPTVALLVVVVGGAALMIGGRLARGEAVLRETVLDAPEVDVGEAG